MVNFGDRLRVYPKHQRSCYREIIEFIRDSRSIAPHTLNECLTLWNTLLCVNFVCTVLDNRWQIFVVNFTAANEILRTKPFVNKDFFFFRCRNYYTKLLLYFYTSVIIKRFFILQIDWNFEVEVLLKLL